jgi:hypothetical protein
MSRWAEFCRQLWLLLVGRSRHGGVREERSDAGEAVPILLSWLMSGHRGEDKAIWIMLRVRRRRAFLLCLLHV